MFTIGASVTMAFCGILPWWVPVLAFFHWLDS